VVCVPITIEIFLIVRSMIFRWLAVPWMQRKLDSYTTMFNTTKKRRDKNKLLPQGARPEDMFLQPEMVNVRDSRQVVPSFISNILSFTCTYSFGR
jgi:hypothetical protein